MKTEPEIIQTEVDATNFHMTKGIHHFTKLGPLIWDRGIPGSSFEGSLR